MRLLSSQAGLCCLHWTPLMCWRNTDSIHSGLYQRVSAVSHLPDELFTVKDARASSHSPGLVVMFYSCQQLSSHDLMRGNTLWMFSLWLELYRLEIYTIWCIRLIRIHSIDKSSYMSNITELSEGNFTAVVKMKTEWNTNYGNHESSLWD